MDKPNCYTCEYREKLIGDAHSRCKNWTAITTGNPHGVSKGWFNWPFNFDPIWLISCNGYKEKQK